MTGRRARIWYVLLAVAIASHLGVGVLIYADWRHVERALPVVMAYSLVVGLLRHGWAGGGKRRRDEPETAEQRLRWYPTWW